MLEPIFRVTGLSVFTFTLAMGLLLGLSMLAVLLFPREFLKSKTILLLGFSTFVFYSWFSARVIGEFDPYFQAQPIRFIFPCLVIYMAWRYFSTGKKYLYYANFALGAVAILWNPDTGIVVFLSWLLTLLYQELAARDVRAIIKAKVIHLLTASVIFSSIILVFTLYIRVRYGAFPDFS